MRVSIVFTFAIFVFCIALPCFATTKGLSQIVTPDLQAPGDLSLSLQGQSRSIANPYELQAELGITSFFEAAIFEGLSPGETIFAAEASILRSGPHLVSAGFINLSTRGGPLQPFLEWGYYTEHHKIIVGGIYAAHQLELVLGWAYDFDPHWRAQVDFQSGTDNFSTLGFTYTLNDRFQFNPALYLSNASSHVVAGYLVLTYTLPLWHANHPMQGASTEAL